MPATISRPTITESVLKDWNDRFALSAAREGWSLWQTDTDRHEIERIDHPEQAAFDWGLFTEEDARAGKPCPIPSLESDEEALEIVRRGAQAGSEMHMLALRIDEAQVVEG